MYYKANSKGEIHTFYSIKFQTFMDHNIGFHHCIWEFNFLVGIHKYN